MTSAYLAATTERLSFCVGVSSPPFSEKSSGRMAHFCTHCADDVAAWVFFGWFFGGVGRLVVVVGGGGEFKGGWVHPHPHTHTPTLLACFSPSSRYFFHCCVFCGRMRVGMGYDFYPAQPTTTSHITKRQTDRQTDGQTDRQTPNTTTTATTTTTNKNNNTANDKPPNHPKQASKHERKNERTKKRTNERKNERTKGRKDTKTHRGALGHLLQRGRLGPEPRRDLERLLVEAVGEAARRVVGDGLAWRVLLGRFFGGGRGLGQGKGGRG